MKVDIERLSVLLDRGRDVETAARQAQRDLQDAETDVRQHTGDDDTAAAALSVLRARAERRRVAHEALQKRALVWREYGATLRETAKKYGGVEL
jgi:hypothetical protein